MEDEESNEAFELPHAEVFMLLAPYLFRIYRKTMAALDDIKTEGRSAGFHFVDGLVYSGTPSAFSIPSDKAVELAGIFSEIFPTPSSVRKAFKELFKRRL